MRVENTFGKIAIFNKSVSVITAIHADKVTFKRNV